ncbi:MAG: response regulator [Bacteroidetes bacterium HGW-Bacteroidetes-22]|nr:MAG: response regulator [Bacteroidetes bacterium HGW-Bacteroidetes-22]
MWGIGKTRFSLFGNITFLITENFFHELDDNLYLLDFILSAAGANVLKATSGKAAIEMADTYKNIDIVLMDIKMPEMDGYTATDEIHRIRPGLPVIAQTAFAMPGDREKALEKGCVAYLPKPIKKNELLELLQQLFSKTG